MPEDVAVVGCDDGELAAALDLTTIAQPLRQSGGAALRLLREQMAGEATIQHSLLETRLVQRRTSAVPWAGSTNETDAVR